MDALIEATARSIAERGLVNTTTNHVAERAGVSIGSLYQYFDGMESLVQALLAKASSDIAAFSVHDPRSLAGAGGAIADHGGGEGSSFSAAALPAMGANADIRE
ncbi:helix-turn-helix domain-containing protein [Solimonas sp. K1W22B-7]|uniref:helix-turn-helix domain-containing protein n=1 Tax=Solimonas sp. K1W22B-7 TaxID=2303331 RepID=UPI001968CCA5|nr:helix-turn-helix domain-containing protein [Solimonas sp. K1W22B-7]